ncbi:transport permease protein [Rhizocola hellebori]|uniref:Transport permease protein n=1 Tax=Rhizocola hellebori TaxID=1392758 RepID=A0A8J3Q399_9ACTN|nr:ABC transporter permease [Rhizocola hellebori]GIH02939.1 transport permease protein [Rhizocola hellebori]
MFFDVVAFETKRMLRNFPSLFFGLAFPVMVLAIFGGIYGNEPSDFWDGRGTVDMSVPAYVGLVVAVAGLMSFPLGMVEYRSRGFLRRLKATPARPGLFLAAQVIVNAVISVLGVGLLVGVGVVAFDLHAPAHPLAFAGIALLSAAAMFGLGMVIASLASTEQTALVIANLVYFPMIFLTGATVPLALMPDAMRAISDALPLSYAVEALQWAWVGGGESITVALYVLGGTVAVSAAIAAWLFRWE